MASSSAALQLLKLSFLLTVFLQTSELGVVGKLPPPPPCSRFECPIYDVIEANNGFDVRLYNFTVWISTAPINATSFVEATETGFFRLFNYTQGNNSGKQKIEMAAPVITQVSRSKEGTYSFVVSFFVPKENQANPPTAPGLTVQKWEMKHEAVRQFSGYANDTNIGQEAADLYADIYRKDWEVGVNKAQISRTPMQYTVAQYNSPFESEGRVNEIWLDVDPNSDASPPM